MIATIENVLCVASIGCVTWCLAGVGIMNDRLRSWVGYVAEKHHHVFFVRVDLFTVVSVDLPVFSLAFYRAMSSYKAARASVSSLFVVARVALEFDSFEKAFVDSFVDRVCWIV